MKVFVYLWILPGLQLFSVTCDVVMHFLTRLLLCSLCILTIFPGWVWVLIASVPDLCTLESDFQADLSHHRTQMTHLWFCHGVITKTCPCNMQQFLKVEKMMILYEKRRHFSYFCSKHTHDLCFRAKIRKNVYPCKPQFTI